MLAISRICIITTYQISFFYQSVVNKYLQNHISLDILMIIFISLSCLSNQFFLVFINICKYGTILRSILFEKIFYSKKSVKKSTIKRIFAHFEAIYIRDIKIQIF